MRKFKESLPLGTGLKFFDKYIETEFSREIWDAIEAMAAETTTLTEGFVLTGGTVTGTAPTAQINESIVVLNGKFLRLEAATGLSYPFYIQEATTVEIDGQFNDLVDRPVIDNEFAETAVSAPVSGQYITIAAAGEYKKSIPAQRIQEESGIILRTKIIEIGDWDMDASDSVNVAHGVDRDKIYGVFAKVRDDSGLSHYPINALSDTIPSSTVAGGVLQITVNDIILGRVDSETFDGINFNQTSYNRGWIKIEYEE